MRAPPQMSPEFSEGDDVMQNPNPLGGGMRAPATPQGGPQQSMTPQNPQGGLQQSNPAYEYMKNMMGQGQQSGNMNKGGVQPPMVYPGMPGAPSSPPGYNQPWGNLGQNAQQNWANMLAGWGAQRGAAMGVPAPYGRYVNGNPIQNPAWNPRAEGRMGGNTGGAYQGGWQGYQPPGTPPIMMNDDADLPLSEILWRQRGGAPRPV
jgi:hypothetical protein